MIFDFIRGIMKKNISLFPEIESAKNNVEEQMSEEHRILNQLDSRINTLKFDKDRIERAIINLEYDKKQIGILRNVSRDVHDYFTKNKDQIIKSIKINETIVDTIIESDDFDTCDAFNTFVLQNYMKYNDMISYSGDKYYDDYLEQNRFGCKIVCIRKKK